MYISALILLSISLWNMTFGERVAICVTGMPARFQPHHLLSFFESNTDYTFDLFYRFQEGSDLVYTTTPSARYEASVFASYDDQTFQSKLVGMYEKFNHVNVTSIKYTPPKSRQQWLEVVGKFDPISQFAHIQQNILNMFEKADHCAEDVKKYQEDNVMRFDYIIHTKEDIFLFQKMSLRNLLAKYKDCDWIGKNCLAWGGLSMRFSIMKPEKGLEFIGSKIKHFKALAQDKKSVYNPEKFDQSLAESLKMKTCAVSVEEVPATSARHVKNGLFCFIGHELFNCIPKGQEKFADIKKCK